MTIGRNRQNPPNRRPGGRPGQGHGSLDDLLWLHKSSGPADGDHIESLAQETLDSQTFAQLLQQNFAKLDPAGQGISKEHLGKLIMRPDTFTQDEYVMLLLMAKYFDTIANLVDDEPGVQTVITGLDKEVLCQFLVHGKLSLAELHRWRLLCMAPQEDTAREGPPLSGSA